MHLLSVQDVIAYGSSALPLEDGVLEGLGVEQTIDLGGAQFLQVAGEAKTGGGHDAEREE